MRKYFIALCLILGACASAESAVVSKYEENRRLEEVAWNAASARRNQECGETSRENPAPKGDASEYGKCYAKVFKEEIQPYSYDPIQLNEYLLSIRKNYVSFDKNDINEDELAILNEEAWNKYIGRLNSQYKSDVAAARQADIESLREVSRGLEEAGESYRNSVQSTTCSMYGNTAYCNTW